MDDVESANEYGNTGSYMNQYRRDLDWARSASDRMMSSTEGESSAGPP